jgi:hypothetical protein
VKLSALSASKASFREFAKACRQGSDMSLERFQATLARVIADTTLIVRIRSGDLAWLGDTDLDPTEQHRLASMCLDDRMEVLCSLYRSNRLTALIRTVPEVVEALGDQLSDVLTDFWQKTPRTDMQFFTEGYGFCRFLDTNCDDPGIKRAVERSIQQLNLFETPQDLTQPIGNTPLS